MKKLSFLLFFCSISVFGQDATNKIALVIHGGAGTITRQNMTPEKEKAYKKNLTPNRSKNG